MERYDNGDIVSPIQEAMKETQGSLLEDLYKKADAKGIERKVITQYLKLRSF